MGCLKKWLHVIAVILLSTVMSASLTSCQLEKKTVRAFIDSPRAEPLLLLLPDYIFPVNLKEYDIPGKDSLDEAAIDSLMIDYSLFLKDINDSVVLARFSNAFIRGLQGFGYKVYPESKLDSVLHGNQRTYVVNLAQMTVEEYIHPYSESYYVGDELVTLKDIDLNALNLNVWIELGAMNGDKKIKVLFASDYLFDRLSGNFRQNFFASQLTFEYAIDTLTVKQFYSMAEYFGGKCSGFLFDFFMNEYLKENLPPDYPYDPQYYHYDHERQMILISESPEDRFTELEEKRR
jgi:hypothetical protein